MGLMFAIYYRTLIEIKLFCERLKARTANDILMAVCVLIEKGVNNRTMGPFSDNQSAVRALCIDFNSRLSYESFTSGG